MSIREESSYHRRITKSACWLLCIALAVATQASAESRTGKMDELLGLPALPAASRSGYDLQKARLGERLFFDQRLSASGQVSCSSCHLPERSFTDGRPRSKGHQGSAGTRNAPSLLNAIYLSSFFWDGRAADLAAQARAPFTNPVEHALADEAALIRIVRDDAQYATAFGRLFAVSPANLQMDMITAALVAYESTLLAGNSPFDRFLYRIDSAAISGAAVRGFELFRGRARCTVCHPIGDRWSLLTDQTYHVAARGVPRAVNENLPALTQRAVAASSKATGRRELERLIATDEDIAALGRFLVTFDPADIGKFKTPSLRNVARTAPYMHDGSVDTLEEAVDLELYSRGIVTYPIVLTRAEKGDLIEFLEALSSTTPRTANAR